MTEQEMRKGGGGKLSRTETVTVRLDPKLRYLAELAARKHRRTLSSYVEWAIKTTLDSEDLRPANAPDYASTTQTLGNEAEYLWDVDDADRFAKLALRYPHLLTHEEQVRWKLIRENGSLWKGSFGGRRKEWAWTVDEDTFNFPRLREHWAAFCLAADTGNGKDGLPTWAKTEAIEPPPVRSPYGGSPTPPPKPAPRPPVSNGGFDDMDDDIPF